MKTIKLGRRAPRQISVFLGSPGDVTEERNAAQDVVTELVVHPLLKGKVAIELVTWTRNSPLENNADPQQAVVKYVGRPSECDLTVILLSGRLGTPFGPRKPDGSAYRSGTEWELEDARRANKPVFLYVHRSPRDPQTGEERLQRSALAEFLAEMTHSHLARNDYDSVDEFRALFREHLLRFVRRQTDTASRVPAAAVVIALVATVAVVYASRPAPPKLRVDSVGTQYVTSDPDSTQQVLLRLHKTVVGGNHGDECLVQASEDESFTGRHVDDPEEAKDVVEDAIPCEGSSSDFLFKLVNRPRVEVWCGWVRVALRRGDRIFKSDPVQIAATTLDDPTKRSAPLASARECKTR